LIAAAPECFFPGGSKYYERVMNHSKQATSVMMCVNGEGLVLPPMVVYQSSTGTAYQKWCEGGPEGTTYAATKSGWFTMEKYNQWFKQVSL
jgi:uncharacterized HAD superfamily protein